METIDFSKGFTDLWNAFGPGIDGIAQALAIVGVALIIGFIGKFLWDKRKGGGSGMSGFPWMAVVIGALLTGPKVLIPVLLQILGLVVNGGITLVNFIITLL